MCFFEREREGETAEGGERKSLDTQRYPEEKEKMKKEEEERWQNESSEVFKMQRKEKMFACPPPSSRSDHLHTLHKWLSVDS